MNRRDFQRKFDPTSQDWWIVEHFGWYEDTDEGNALLKAHVGGTIERVQELRTLCKQFIAGEIELEDSDFYKYAKTFEDAMDQEHPRKGEPPSEDNNLTEYGYCGWLQWTVEQYGRLTHKHSCPNRVDPWCQSHPDVCPSEN